MKYILTINHPSGENTTILEERPWIREGHGFVKITGTSIGSDYEVYVSPYSLPYFSIIEVSDEMALDYVERQTGRGARTEAARLWGIEEENG